MAEILTKNVKNRTFQSLCESHCTCIMYPEEDQQGQKSNN